MNTRPLLMLATLAAATSPDLGKDAVARFKDGVRDGFKRDPMGTVLAAVVSSAWLFYKAERGHNPKVTSFYDALVYCSTNMSVGYSDIFARTPAGKAIGTALMTYGPAMTSRIFEAPQDPAARPEPTSSDVVDRLDRILAALEALKAPVTA
ncbi:MAG: ion channel [Deltaproteobacteria bacterium]